MDTISKKIFVAQDMTGSLTSESVKLVNMLHVSYHLRWTGTPTGNLYIDVSTEAQPQAWEQLATVPVAGAGSQLWLDRNVPYIWARIRYVPTAGTGTMDGTVTSKGDN